MKYKISCTWMMSAEIEIEADSSEEAIQKAYDETGLPEDGEYVSSSFEVDEEVELINESKKDVEEISIS
jgi:hypothetical protein